MSSFLGRVATTQHPTLPKKGVTIGDGDADYNGGDERPFLQAIADGAKHLEVIAGNFNFKTAVALAGNDISISCRGGVRFTPTPSGAVGLFDFTGDRIRVRGLTVDVPGFVPSQNVLQFSGQDVWIEDNTFTCLDAVASGFNGTPGPAAGHASNEMKLIGMTNCNAKRVIKNTFFPNKGVTCVQSFGSGLTNAPGSGIFAHNIARSLSRAYLPAFTDCWRVFDLFGDEYSIIQGNCIFQLGNAVNCDSVIFIRGHLTPAVESGHILIQGNHVERVKTPSGIKLWGVPSTSMLANNLGLFGPTAAPSTPAAAGEAGIIVTGGDGTATGVESASILICGNELHNLSSANGTFLWANRCNSLSFTNNLMTLVQSVFAVQILPRTGGVANANGVRRFVARGNDARSDAGGTTTHVFRFEAGTFDDGVVVQDNNRFGIANLVSDASGAGAAGRRKILTGIQDTSTGNDPLAGASTANLNTNVRLDA